MTLQQSDKETIQGVSPGLQCRRFSDEGWSAIETHVPEEMDLTIYVNQKELVTILCTPTKLNCLVVGFLYDEGIISNMSDIASMRVCEDDSLADVRLVSKEFKVPESRTLTSGCGGGATFKRQGQPVETRFLVPPSKLLSLMKQFQDKMELYRSCGGVHASALADGKNIMMIAEDIGRHNTLDKIQGECLLRNIPINDAVLLTTGRVSSEMLVKTARMRVPVVVSRTSPTLRAVSLADELGIALVGYAKANRMLVYSHPERLGAA